MPFFAPTCMSWRHESPVAAAAGRFVCDQHIDEEPHILRELGELAVVERDIALYEANKEEVRRRKLREHGDSAKSLERSLATFFNQAVEIGGMAVEGYKGATQIDVAVPRKQRDPHFSATARVLHRATGDRLAVHLEVAYRTDPRTVAAKLATMLDSLDESIREALHARVQPPFTGLALLGPAWRQRQLEMMQMLHERYARARRVRVAGKHCWNFPDVIATSACTYKKHDLFAGPSEKASRVPCMFPFLSGGEHLRALAIVRGYMRHRIRVLRGEARAESSAWRGDEAGAIAGRLPIFTVPSEVAPLVLRPKAGRLWHLGFERNEQRDRERPVFVPHVQWPSFLFVSEPRHGNVVGRWRRSPSDV